MRPDLLNLRKVRRFAFLLVVISLFSLTLIELAKKEIILRLTNYTSVPANEHECAICLCELDENVVELSKCKHQFHEVRLLSLP